MWQGSLDRHQGSGRSFNEQVRNRAAGFRPLALHHDMGRPDAGAHQQYRASTTQAAVTNNGLRAVGMQPHAILPKFADSHGVAPTPTDDYDLGNYYKAGDQAFRAWKDQQLPGLAEGNLKTRGPPAPMQRVARSLSDKQLNEFKRGGPDSFGGYQFWFGNWSELMGAVRYPRTNDYRARASPYIVHMVFRICRDWQVVGWGMLWARR